MYKVDLKEIKRQANGNWRWILNASGIDGCFLKNKNGPCPFCGGKDRWRWDNKGGEGSGFYHQCDARGSGFSILAKWLGLEGRSNLPKLLEKIAEIVGTSSSPIGSVTQSQDERTRAEYFQRVARKISEEAQPLGITHQCPAIQYFKLRDINRLAHTNSLRVHPKLDYSSNGKVAGGFNAVIGKVVDNQGNFLGVHRTFLSASGTKANVSQPKMLLGSVAGGSIQLDVAEEIVSVAEGLETALAIRERWGQPTWAAMSATNLEKLNVPSTVKTVYIWADLERSGTGGTVERGN